MRSWGMSKIRGRPVWLVAAALLTLLAASACSAPAESAQAKLTGMPMPGPGTLPILGPATGTGHRTFTITARQRLYYWFGCLGHAHVVWVLARPSFGGYIAVACSASGGQFGGDSDTIPKDHVGKKIIIHVDAPAGTTWRLRIDGSRH
jgi:hypothetical protein